MPNGENIVTVARELRSGEYLGGEPTTLRALEDAIMAMVECPSLYDADIALSLLSCYLMWPAARKMEVVQSVMALALVQLPKADFALCQAQVPLSLQTNDPGVRALIAAEAKLQSCRFAEFWALLDSEPSLKAIAENPGFTDGIRLHIAGLIALTYRTMRIADAAQMLNLTGDQFQQFFTRKLADGSSSNSCGKWTIEDEILKLESPITPTTTKLACQRPILSVETISECLQALRKMAASCE